MNRVVIIRVEYIRLPTIRNLMKEKGIDINQDDVESDLDVTLGKVVKNETFKALTELFECQIIGKAREELNMKHFGVRRKFKQLN